MKNKKKAESLRAEVKKAGEREKNEKGEEIEGTSGLDRANGFILNDTKTDEDGNVVTQPVFYVVDKKYPAIPQRFHRQRCC